MAKKSSGLPESTMHVWFAAGSILMLGATVYAFYQDHYGRGFTDFQDLYRKQEIARLEEERKEEIKDLASDPEFVKRYDTLKEQVKKSEATAKAAKERIAPLQAEAAKEQDQIAKITRTLNAMKANYDMLKSQVDSGIEKNPGRLLEDDKKIQEVFAEQYKHQHAKDDKLAEIAKIQSEVAGTQRDWQGLLTELNDLDAKKAKAVGIPILNAIKDAPGLDFIQPNLKIEQVKLDNLPWSVFFANTSRVDRCVTCHMGIDSTDPKFANFTGYKKVMQSHPRLDLYVGANSKHPYKKFGCSICHGGQPSAVEFSRVAHSPQNEQQAKYWEKQYNWEPQEFWDAKMLPLQHVEASCAKCHKGVDEVPEAAKLNEGRHLFRDRGCVNCHMGNSGGADMSWVGRVGPDLRRIGEKTQISWARGWIENPWNFRPSTKMPRFFGLENRKDLTIPDNSGGHHVRDSVEAAAIAEYIFMASQLRETPPPPPGEGDVENGRKIFTLVGCIGCHTTRESKDDKYDLNQHGPDLSRVGEKVSPGWLFQWLKNPRHYWAETKMPNLRLSDKEAADVTSFLMKTMVVNKEVKKPAEFPTEAFEFIIADKLASTTPAAIIRQSLDDPIAMVEKGLKLKVKYAISNGKQTDTGDGEWSEPQIARIKEIIGRQPDPKRAAKAFYAGETLIQHHGCYGCHNIQGWTYAPLTCVNLNGESDKDLDKFDFGKAGHDHSIAETKWDWFYTKISRPRVFDRDKEALIRPFDRLRMPWFGYTTKETVAAADVKEGAKESKEGVQGEPGAKSEGTSEHEPKRYAPMNNKDVSSTQVLGHHDIERLVTYLLSLSNEAVPGENMHAATPREVALDHGRRVIRELNCTGCHLISAGSSVTQNGATSIPLEAFVATTTAKSKSYFNSIPDKGIYSDEDLISLDYNSADVNFIGFVNIKRGTYLNDSTVPILMHEYKTRTSPLTPWETLDFRLEKKSKGEGWVTYGSLVSADKFKALTKAFYATEEDQTAMYATLANQYVELNAYERMAGSEALKLNDFERERRKTNRKFYDPIIIKVRMTRGEGRIMQHIFDKETEYENPLAKLFQSTPPRLSAEGVKVQPDWLYQFLHNVYPLRVGLNIRMPSFWTDGPYSAYKTIYPAGRLSAVDRIKRSKGVGGEPLPGPDAVAFADIPDDAQQVADFFTADVGEKPYGHQSQLLDAAQSVLYENGKKIVMTPAGTDPKNVAGSVCITCHSVGNYIQKEPKYAPNLANVKRRLKEDWVRRFILYPPSIYPGTNMPGNFIPDWNGYNHVFTDATRGILDDEAVFKDKLNQMNAVRFFLLHAGDAELGADVKAAPAVPAAPATPATPATPAAKPDAPAEK